MDHAIDSLRPYLEVECWEFMEYWETGNYKNFVDVPNYVALKSLIDATNILRRYLGLDNLTVKDMISYYE